MGGDKYSQGRRGYWRQRVHNSPRVDIIVARGEDSEGILADYQDDLVDNLATQPSLAGGWAELGSF